jgi:hypothetical protein
MSIFSTIKEVPWSKVLSERGLNEIALVKKHFYSLETLKHLFNTAGESFPKELIDYLKNNPTPNNGSETEVYIKNKHIDLKAKDAGRADMLITFEVNGPTGSEPETHAIWIETQDQNGVWDSVHQAQWWNKSKSLKGQYDKVTTFMVASEFPKGYIDEFNEWQFAFTTHAIEFKFYDSGNAAYELKTDSKQESSKEVNGLSNIEIKRDEFYQDLKSEYKDSNITIEASQSEIKQGYIHLKVDGEKTGYYFRHLQDSLGIGFQGDSNPSRMVKSTYDIVKSNPEEVIKQVSICSGLKLENLTKKGKKDLIIGSKQLRSLDDAKSLINAFVSCIPNLISSSTDKDAK